MARRIIIAIIMVIINISDNDNFDITNSPGQRPIGVLDLRYSPGSFWNVPRPRKVGGPGPSAAKVGPRPSRQPPVNLRQGHGDLLFAMDSFDAFTILPKNDGCEPSIHLDFDSFSKMLST